MKKIKIADLKELQSAIYYLHMEELKDICTRLQLSISGKKGDLVKRILTFLESGKQTAVISLPDESKAKKGIDYPLTPSTKIVSGAYKNDAATRSFMKKLVGDHFHFTAFGQDWIRKRWMAGNPPTYAEFAIFWQGENERRKREKASPKQEWAYLNFVQRCAEKNPSMTKSQIGKEWEVERKRQADKVKKMLEYYISA